jgi:4-diphosphocytidyl-2-C-methyl-D-erythritol kinase
MRLDFPRSSVLSPRLCPMRLLAPAKINLHLRVGPPRADGFHPILTWICTIGLFDELELAQSSQTRLECDQPEIPTGMENLVVRAAAALGVTAKMKLTKQIPVGGGLAGGSSDAARALLGLDQLWNLNRSRQELAAVAARLGSDVPFFLHAPSAVCTGVGETVRTTPVPAARWALLILPPMSMPTPKVYQRFDQMKLPDARSIEREPDFAAWAILPALQLLPLLVNDLEQAAFDLNPRLSELRKQWQSQLGQPVRMSGSGSTLFTLYDTRAQARAAAKEGSRVVELAPDFSDDLTGRR